MFMFYKMHPVIREICGYKLLKQAFAIAKSGLIYDGEYKSTLVKN
ncbi:MAG: hypothetical protein ACJAX3_002773 [Patiriisocius sp.]|jgi:hypothetical protein